MEYTQLEILIQCGAEYLDITRVLFYGYIIFIAYNFFIRSCFGIFYRSIVKICIVLNVFYSSFQLGFPMVDTQFPSIRVRMIFDKSLLSHQ